MPLKLISGMLKSSGDEALLFMDTGIANQIVLVAKQAFLDIADPPRWDECRLQQYIDAFSKIASVKYDRGEFAGGGRIQITADDVAAWKTRTSARLHS